MPGRTFPKSRRMNLGLSIFRPEDTPVRGTTAANSTQHHRDGELTKQGKLFDHRTNRLGDS